MILLVAVTPSLFSSLALIYPCVTGMLSGMSKSIHLKNPSKSIPKVHSIKFESIHCVLESNIKLIHSAVVCLSFKGMFWSIITATLVYLTVIWLFGLTIANRTLKVDKFVTASVSFPHELILRGGVVISCLGLILGCMSTAPGLIAAMSADDILPCLRFLRLDSEDAKPTKALWFTAVLVALPTLGGKLDNVSPFATIFYLLMYSGVNASTCISGFVRPPGFRPTFRYFHWSVSFVGFIWCLGLSFCISGIGTFVSLLVFLLMHGFIKKARRLVQSGAKWGTLGSAVRYVPELKALVALSFLTSLNMHRPATFWKIQYCIFCSELPCQVSCKFCYISYRGDNVYRR